MKRMLLVFVCCWLLVGSASADGWRLPAPRSGQFALSISTDFFDHTELLFNHLEKQYVFVFPEPVRSTYTSDNAGFPIVFRFYSTGWGVATYFWQYTDQDVFYTTDDGANWLYFGSMEDANAILCGGTCWGNSSTGLNETEVRGIVDNVLNVVGSTLSGGLTEQLQAVLSAALTTSSSSTCPRVVNNAPGGIDLSNLAALPSPLVITVDYGSGCRTSSGEWMSGNAKLTASNISVNSSSGVLSATFVAQLNSLKRDNTLLGSGSVSGSISGNLNSLTGSADLSLSSFVLSNGETLTGTVSVQLQSSSNMLVQLNTKTSKITASLDLAVLVQDKSYTLNTRSAGTVNGYSVSFSNVVFNTATCPSYPLAGQLLFSKAGKTATVTFNNACNGSYSYR